MIERSYQGIKDQSLMLDLVHRNPAENLHVVDLPYRLSSWALSEPENIRLWFDDTGNLRALGCITTPFLDQLTMPSTRLRTANYIAGFWTGAVGRAYELHGNPDFGRPSWYVNVLAGQSERMGRSWRKGFLPIR